VRDGQYHAVAESILSFDVEALFDDLEKRNDENYANNDEAVLREHCADIASRIRQLADKLR
jgi:hypothetical protein